MSKDGIAVLAINHELLEQTQFNLQPSEAIVSWAHTTGSNDLTLV